MIYEYARFHVLRCFFESYNSWESFQNEYHLTEPVSYIEYGNFLYGCDAEIEIPLWASVCVDEKASLLNETTLDIIAHYKKFGCPIHRMQGNPPDYIGQMLFYLEYLASLLVKNPCRQEIKEEYLYFTTHYYTPTVNTIQAHAKQYAFSEGIQFILNLLTLENAPELSERLIHFSSSFDTFSLEELPAAEIKESEIFSNCSFGDCGRKCKMLSAVQEGCILSVKPDTTFEGKKFRSCPRGAQYRQTFLSPRRLRYPMKRIGKRGEGKFVRISWEEAEEYLAGILTDSARSDDPESRYILPGSGVSALVRGDKFLRDLLSLTGGFLSFYNYYSCACAETALPYVFGTDVCGSSYQEMEKTKLLILWGHNPENTIWGDEFLPCLKRAKENGVPIIVIDPRYSETAVKYADQWIGILPGTDGALADAMAYEIWQRGLQDQAFMDQFCIGFDESHMPDGIPQEECYRAYLFGEKDGVVKDAAWASKITHIPAEEIISLALKYAMTKPACLMPGLGPQRTLCGEQNCRSIAMLACLTGNVGLPGGWSGGYPNKNGCDTPSYKIRENPFPGKIPSFLWTKAARDWSHMNSQDGLKGVSFLRSGIKVMFSIASGMLLTQHSNSNETAEILSSDQIETLVVSDLFMTPAARYADLLLPGTSFFETDNIVPPWNASNYLLYNQKAIEPLFEARFEYEWVARVADWMHLGNEISQGRTQREWLSYLYNIFREKHPEIPEFEEFREAGCVVFPEPPYQIAFEEQRKERKKFNTPSGKIEIFSERLYHSGCLPGVPSYTPCEEGVSDLEAITEFPLQLIGFHTLRRCHSTHDNNPNLDAYEKPELWIHPLDAEVRQIQDGQTIEVYNRRGRIRIPAKVTNRIVPGAVALSEGGWFIPDPNGVDTRGCINVLTLSHTGTPLAHANPQHTALVQVQPALSDK